MSLIYLCERMLSDLSTHTETNQSKLFSRYVRERLEKSYEIYDKELQSSLDYLKRRNELNTIKRLNKL